ncbi:hypothetical protein EMIHUDRAFT_438278 [Emiliania huxleyi CCMP1516]|uniref:Uncharacterized protein n=2 Tax=Emiliania huxleyi TaxID=2903 RepID=A0A0D3IBJ1_EMIH1|nr:hypothetical protein EMIHUDRAFT_438278 [Emiliania huxleyi CCMP1516]EOD08626.1 hypothetical protein EMIHUDRAFT_438278 [Emiliania huxleyi CCMP1516]|eukprot:XP_005761055.1 hypothetical protein EMIHUDRAFT_438278 [Emiliania huxleyi CCMP1516]
MAPASVLADHLVMKICHTKPTESESLLALGARITAQGANALIELIQRWRTAHADVAGGASQGPAASQGGASAAGASQGGAPMQLPTETYTPAAPWKLAVPPAGKKPPVWDASWRRFQQGQKESIEQIALTQVSGKAILPSTVSGHLLTALVQGRPVDLARLAQQVTAQGLAPPSEDEWDRLESAEAASGIDVVTTLKLVKTDMCKVFLPAAEKEWAERDDAEKAEVSYWYAKLDWYTAFRKVGLVPSFAGAAKQARMA